MEIGLLLTDSLSLFEALIGKGGLTPATVFVVEGLAKGKSASPTSETESFTASIFRGVPKFLQIAAIA